MSLIVINIQIYICMKRIILSLGAAVMTVAAMTGATRLVKVPVEVKAISTSSTLSVTVKESQSPAKVTISGPDKAIIDEITATVKGGDLAISTSYRGKNTGERYKNVTITYEGVLPSGYSASSGGKIKVLGAVTKTGDMNIGASSSGDVEIPAVTCATLRIAASSSGDVELGSVKAGSLNIGVSSSADVDIASVTCTDAVIVASSSAEVEIKNLIADTATSSASSSGEIEVKNSQCKNINVTASSSADFKFTQVKTDNLCIVASSSSKTVFDKLSCGNVSASASSGGDIILNGSAKKATLSATSGGSVIRKGFTCPSPAITTGSGGKVK